jgi:hypothetical protein
LLEFCPKFNTLNAINEMMINGKAIAIVPDYAASLKFNLFNKIYGFAVVSNQIADVDELWRLKYSGSTELHDLGKTFNTHKAWKREK